MASIVQRGKSKDTYAVTYYTTGLDGRKKKEWISGLTKDEAKIKKREIEIAIAKGNVALPTNITVGAFLCDFIQKVAKNVGSRLLIRRTPRYCEIMSFLISAVRNCAI